MAVGLEGAEPEALEPSAPASGKFGFAFRFTSKLQKKSAFGAEEEHGAAAAEAGRGDAAGVSGGARGNAAAANVRAQKGLNPTTVSYLQGECNMDHQNRDTKKHKNHTKNHAKNPQ